MQDFAKKYLQRGAMAMTHTESQLQFVQGNAAMIFCGLWLENEMKNSTPPDAELRAFTLPAFEGCKGNPRLFHGQGMEYLFVPRDAKNADIAFEFARYLVSPAAAADMGKTIGWAMVLAVAGFGALAGCEVQPLHEACPLDQDVLDKQICNGAVGTVSCVVKRHPQCDQSICISFNSQPALCSRTCETDTDCPQGDDGDFCYRLRLAGIENREGEELFPSIRMLAKLATPPGMA